MAKVMPKSLHDSYKAAQQADLMQFDFIALARERQG